MYRLQDAPEAAPDKYGASPAALSDLWRRVFLRGNQAKTEPAFDARSLENQGERREWRRRALLGSGTATSLTLGRPEGATRPWRPRIMTIRPRLIAVAASLALALGASAVAAMVAHATPAWAGPVLIPSAQPGDTMAVLYSGDGGWGPLDQKVAQRLADHGVPTIGVNSLAYFRTKRTADSIAADLAAELRLRDQEWGRGKVVLIGYSFGADALPAIIPRLPSDLRARVSHVVLIGTGPVGDLRFHPLSWLNLAPRDSFAVAPAIAAAKDMKITCIYGDQERHDICPDLPDERVTKVRLPGGHHFNGDYARLGEAVLEASR